MEGKGIDTKSIQEIGWLKLDNAAKLFPAIMSGELTSVFRITASLKEPVKFSAIKEAVEITSNGIILPDSPVADGEMEDGYNRFFRKKIPPPGKLTKAWHLPFSLNEKP